MASVYMLIDVARAEKQLGNDLFHQTMFGRAMRKYEKVCTCSFVHVCVCTVVLIRDHYENVWFPGFCTYKIQALAEKPYWYCYSNVVPFNDVECRNISIYNGYQSFSATCLSA